jgi:hypothetical protein
MHVHEPHVKEIQERSMVAKLSTIRRKIRTGQKIGFSERARAVNKGLLPSVAKKSSKKKRSTRKV